ncbi:MAG: hypothetical protein ACOY3K_05085 [Candidatus Omnitrophota bacterium]
MSTSAIAFVTALGSFQEHEIPYWRSEGPEGRAGSADMKNRPRSCPTKRASGPLPSNGTLLLNASATSPGSPLKVLAESLGSAKSIETVPSSASYPIQGTPRRSTCHLLRETARAVKSPRTSARGRS